MWTRVIVVLVADLELPRVYVFSSIHPACCGTGCKFACSQGNEDIDKKVFGVFILMFLEVDHFERIDSVIHHMFPQKVIVRGVIVYQAQAFRWEVPVLRDFLEHEVDGCVAELRNLTHVSEDVDAADFGG